MTIIDAVVLGFLVGIGATCLTYVSITGYQLEQRNKQRNIDYAYERNKIINRL